MGGRILPGNEVREWLQRQGRLFHLQVEIEIWNFWKSMKFNENVKFLRRFLKFLNRKLKFLDIF